MAKSPLRSLPSVSKLLGHPLLKGYPHTVAVEAARQSLDEARSNGQGGSDHDALANRAAELAERLVTPGFQPLVNCTGTILNTGLGRAKLAPAAVEAAVRAAGHVSLEIDLALGTRGDRQASLRALLTDLTGAESALVVNNNAAAVLLTLNTFCRGRKVLLSRGQSVEIGGSFRMPDVVRASGASLVDIGTTNKTRISDYTSNTDEETAAYLRCHPSNFWIGGFSEEPGVGELAEAARARSLLLIDDVGSGCLVNTDQFGLPHEATITEALMAGADIVTASGDKLLGGPQAGLILGRDALIKTIAKNPMARALRIDKVTAAALEATLMLYNQGLQMSIPTLRYLARSEREVKDIAQKLAAKLKKANIACEVTKGESEPGGGSLPGCVLPSCRVSIGSPDPDAVSLKARLRGVVGYIAEGRFHLDMRTVDEDELPKIVSALQP